ncbi:hypothetical protein [Ralstonia pseudosolanacearum]|uniref:hypothetical protein n=1 Tax=Ralstonia pseudosolanacearum TaxID=1310165 RepID=UPI0013156DF7|nr:hypothetical protein [Ralstonia pseudosolanacearum]QWF10337.1 hypothetical protein KME70_09725 [Ralstonia solanacearum]
MKLLSLFKRLVRKPRVEAPPTAPVPTSTPAPAPRKRRRKKRNSKRHTPPGARRIDPNTPWLNQARSNDD